MRSSPIYGPGPIYPGQHGHRLLVGSLACVAFILVFAMAARAYEGWQGAGWYAPSPTNANVLLMGPYKSQKACERQSGLPFNHQVWEGAVDSATAMSGTVMNSLLGVTCRWQAHRR